jgi:TrmH family RNA methyltransferase
LVNLGTIMRTIAGLGYKDLAVIGPAADIFDPKTVRASDGSIVQDQLRTL